MNKRQMQDRASGMGIDASGTKAEIEARIAAAIAAQAAEQSEAAEAATTDDADYEAQMAAMEADNEDEPTAAKRMTATLNRYKGGYTASLTASGTKSQHTGDDLAFALAGMEPADVATAAERILDLGIGFLISDDGISGRYDHLNNGQIRMNSGNRIRAAIKRQDITINDAMEAIAAI